MSESDVCLRARNGRAAAWRTPLTAGLLVGFWLGFLNPPWPHSYIALRIGPRRSCHHAVAMAR